MIQSKMTIEDYLKSVSGKYKVIRQDLKPQNESQKSIATDFNGILSTFKKPSRQTEQKSNKGLSVADYRTHPISTIAKQTGSILPANAYNGTHSATKDDQSGLMNPAPLKSSSSTNPDAMITSRNHRPMTSQTLSDNDLIFSPAGNSTTLSKTNPAQSKIEKAIQDASAQYQISSKLIKGVIKAESNYNANAVSPAGAQGLMQLMPGTARDLGVTNPFDIKQNIDGGTRYLKKMMDMFGGNIRKALSAYNAGPEAVKRYNGNVPYSETRQYVERVINNAKSDV
jgi:hypothetical protein